METFETKNEERRDTNHSIEGVLHDFGEVDALESSYQDSDNADSPLSSDTDVDDDNDDVRKKKKKKESYPRYNPSTPVEVLEDVRLEFGMMFRDKQHLREILDSYRITKGYNLKMQKSDKGRLQVCCLGQGCQWNLWASHPQGEKSFQIKKLPYPHTCIPFSFEKGKRKVSSDSRKYMETFLLQPTLRMRELRHLVERDLNYKASMSMCGRTRKKALALIIGDYKAQFGMLRSYVHEVLSKNRGSTIKFAVRNTEDGQSVFRGLYICLRSLKRVS